MAFWNFKDDKARARADEAVAQFRSIRARLQDDLQKQAPVVKKGLLPEFPPGDPWASPQGDQGSKNDLKPFVKVELPAVSPGPWGDPQKVSQALACHDQGNFRVSGLLMNALLTDPAIRGTMDVRVKALTGLNYHFKPANDTEQAKECADYVTAHFRDWLTCEEQERFTRSRLLMGASLAQKIWTTVGSGPDKMTVPSVNCWEPQWIYWWWDGTNRNFGHWQVIHSQGVEEPIVAGRDWIWAMNTQKDAQYTGLIRSLGLRFVARLQALQGLGVYQQRYALAILKLFQPATFDEADVYQIQSNILSTSTPLVTLPRGDTPEASWDLEWENIDSTSGWEVFIKTLDVLKAEMAIDILGQTLTSDTGSGGGGSHAQAKVHDAVRMDLRVSDAKQDAKIWREQLLKPFAALNYNDPELAPLMEYETEVSPSLDQRADALNKLSVFLTAVGLGVQPPATQTPTNPDGSPGTPSAAPTKPTLGDLIDGERLLREFGIPLKSDPEEDIE